jgi:hypothetical protein
MTGAQKWTCCETDKICGNTCCSVANTCGSVNKNGSGNCYASPKDIYETVDTCTGCPTHLIPGLREWVLRALSGPWTYTDSTSTSFAKDKCSALGRIVLNTPEAQRAAYGMILTLSCGKESFDYRFVSSRSLRTQFPILPPPSVLVICGTPPSQRCPVSVMYSI